MRIVTLMENTAAMPSLTAEHGLSLYIETGDRRILFDTGASEAFAANAEKLGVQLSSVDFAVLSHGHSDHGGGLCCFLALNDRAPVYVSKYAFGQHCDAVGNYIGLDSALLESGRMVFVEDTLQLGPGISLHCPQGAFGDTPLDTAGLQVRVGGSLGPEDFRHEQYLRIEEDGKQVLFSGCSHRGILNITERFRPDILIGGFHFMKRDPATLDPAAQRLLTYATRYYTGHCTGQAQYDHLKGIMGDRLEYLSTGTSVIV